MRVNYEKKPEMTLIGYYTEIRPEDGYKKCPEFWDKEFAARYARLWKTMKPETKIEEAILKNGIGTFAICTESENGFQTKVKKLMPMERQLSRYILTVILSLRITNVVYGYLFRQDKSDLMLIKYSV